MIETALVAVVNSTTGDDSGIDEELIEEARRHLGMKPRNAAMNEVLRRFIEEQRAQRRTALEELRELSEQGAFNYDALDGDASSTPAH